MGLLIINLRILLNSRSIEVDQFFLVCRGIKLTDDILVAFELIEQVRHGQTWVFGAHLCLLVVWLHESTLSGAACHLELLGEALKCLLYLRKPLK